MIRILVQEPLPQPKRITPGHWAAIDDAYQRLGRAVESEDFAHVVGAAKELTESVARVTTEAHGNVYADNAPYSTLLSAAHGIVAHAIKPNLAPNDVLRAIPDNARKMATQLAEIRNRYGTGHGRADVHMVTEEVAEACVHASLIWVRWVLARHTTVLLGNVTQLVSDLETENFSRGELAERLDAANVPGLEEPEQRRLGVAVGRRMAANAPIAVELDGVRACSTNPERWPDAYRTGVIEGLFINGDNQVDPRHTVSPLGATYVLEHHSDPTGVLTELRRLIGAASWSFRLKGGHEDVIGTMRATLLRVPADGQALWADITNTLAARVPHEVS
ncbi:abortive infection family protein [Streptomyces goshikiensis]|uniref:abortive infection family protein n=1 Tax=Streptomyces goshikiensis TaxID=1942 RepID=UPI003805BACE